MKQLINWKAKLKLWSEKSKEIKTLKNYHMKVFEIKGMCSQSKITTDVNIKKQYQEEEWIPLMEDTVK